ncbi:MAG TPA: hypothetical protein VIS76_00005, partial [Pseudomonadales bacterium]
MGFSLMVWLSEVIIHLLLGGLSAAAAGACSTRDEARRRAPHGLERHADDLGCLLVLRRQLSELFGGDAVRQPADQIDRPCQLGLGEAAAELRGSLVTIVFAVLEVLNGSKHRAGQNGQRSEDFGDRGVGL